MQRRFSFSFGETFRQSARLAILRSKSRRPWNPTSPQSLRTNFSGQSSSTNARDGKPPTGFPGCQGCRNRETLNLSSGYAAKVHGEYQEVLGGRSRRACRETGSQTRPPPAWPQPWSARQISPAGPGRPRQRVSSDAQRRAKGPAEAGAETPVLRCSQGPGAGCTQARRALPATAGSAQDGLGFHQTRPDRCVGSCR